MLKYWGTILTHKNSVHEETESRLKSGNACYHSVQNLLSSRLLSKYREIYRTVILPVFFVSVRLGLKNVGGLLAEAFR
jgi:hypothetical protein